MIGEVVLVFDARAWDKNGGDDVASRNAIFYKKAKIMRIYKEERVVNQRGQRRKLCDVEFLHDERLSKGHFLYGIKRL